MTNQEISHQSYRSMIQTFIDEWKNLDSSSEDPIDEHNAFRDYATHCVLQENYEKSLEDIRYITRCDEGNDKGIDGWFLDEDGNNLTLHLFQSKDTDLNVSDIDKLVNGFMNLFPTSRSNSFSRSNRYIQEEAMTFETNVLNTDKECKIKFYALTSRLKAPSVEDRLRDFQRTRTIEVAGRNLEADLEIIDIQELASSLTSGYSDPIDFSTEVKRDHYLLTTEGDFRAATVVVSGRELADLYNTHKINLFRNNPRYYQQARGTVNKGILDGLTSQDGRRKFYIYNNGLTATCDSLVIRDPQTGNLLARSGDDQEVTVSCTNFQIVNGCQTTVTLHTAYNSRADTQGLEDVQVQLKIIESEANIAPQVALYTNSQNPMKAADFRANDPLQGRLHDEFKSLRRAGQRWNWFYEYKRGVWATDFRSQTDRRDFTRDADQDNYGTARKFDMTTLAQTSLSFLGESRTASDSPGKIFSDVQVYKKVFPDTVTANQLLLPYVIFMEIPLVVDRLNLPRDANWFLYMRRKTVGIVGMLLNTLVNDRRLPDPENGIPYFTSEESAKLIVSIKDWGEDLVEKAYRGMISEAERIADYESTSNSEGQVTLRSISRRSDWVLTAFQSIEDAFLNQLHVELETTQSTGLDRAEVGFRAKFPFDISDIPLYL